MSKAARSRARRAQAAARRELDTRRRTRTLYAAVAVVAAAVDAELEAAEAAATENGIRGTPSFAVGRTGGALRVVELDSLDAQALRPDLDALLAG
jgi:protein-disulfide isomerase